MAYEYRVPSQFVLQAIGGGATLLALPAVASMPYYISGINLQLVGSTTGAGLASVVGVGTGPNGVGYQVNAVSPTGGAAVSLMNDDYVPPLQCLIGATIGLNLPAPGPATWVAQLFGFLGNPNS